MGTHSPLGASGAERWMRCPGSVRLLQLLQLDESDEEDYRTEGTAAHAAAAWCLNNQADAWETVGTKHGDPGHEIVMTPALADPLQIYLNYVRAKPLQKRFVEYAISSPVHPLFFGTLDHGGIGLTASGIYIDVDDLKMGAGIYVDVEDNPQLKYYAFGLIDGIERQEGRPLADNADVNLSICQPRMTWAEPVRTWTTSVYKIKTWVHGVLVPAMKATELDDSLDFGEHCRFCPAKLVCPLLTAMFKAAAVANPKHVEGMSIERLGLEYRAAKAVKFYISAVEKETHKALLRGDVSDDVKLVRKKANRDWKPEADALTRMKFGGEALTAPKLKSPAQIEELPGGPDWVKEYAFTPDMGTTVALASDPGHAIKVPKLADRFGAASDTLREQLTASAEATKETW